MDLKAISELKGYTFVIPYQQRGYKWTSDNVKVLLDDFKEFLDNEKPMYCLQPIAVAPTEEENKWIVIDGQQRLTTLFLLWKYFGEDPYYFVFERDIKNDKTNNSKEQRETFLKEIDKITAENTDGIDFFYISRAFLTIKEWFKNKCESDLYCSNCFHKLLDAPKDKKSIQILWYEVQNGKEHETFRNINSGKIQLSNSDLIKALLLNKTNDFENRQQIAAQFELMERQLAEDRFWYMLQQKDVEPLKGQSRIDLLFNIVAGIKYDEYQIEPRKSFYKFSDCSTKQLLEMWKEVREKYQRLRDLFDNPYTFHYIGFLIYCVPNPNACTNKLFGFVNEYAQRKKSEFVSYLQEEIKKGMEHQILDEYSYDDSKFALRKLFVLHNIETILSRYRELKNKKYLKFSFENFPFELLNKQNWNIEHIASNTDNNLSSANDRRDWIDSVFSDFPHLGEDPKIKELKQEAENDLKNKVNFDELYKYVVVKVDDNPIKDEKNKKGIGNLVLLDEHTNKSFHNSLFSRKRRIVIMASGLRNDNDTELNVESVYVPVCTQQVYTKSYNKQSNVNLNCWGRDDYNAYFADMQEKLKFYFETKHGEQ
ncbi:MAG: DUF262 domain-containing protein [Paludibacteraceae bacterium]|nr:DUF262 domain-containing protein [Paludibacteraceae bacterium]